MPKDVCGASGRSTRNQRLQLLLNTKETPARSNNILNPRPWSDHGLEHLDGAWQLLDRVREPEAERPQEDAATQAVQQQRWDHIFDGWGVVKGGKKITKGQGKGFKEKGPEGPSSHPPETAPVAKTMRGFLDPSILKGLYKKNEAEQATRSGYWSPQPQHPHSHLSKRLQHNKNPTSNS